jgi:phage shock protein A
MAQGGFFARLANLWRGFLSLLISGAEKKNPEIAYENAINSMIEKYSSLKAATGSLIARREELQQRHDAREKELAQTELDLNAAVESGQDDLALVLIQKKTALQTEVAELHTDMQAAMNDADTAKASLLQVQAEIKKLKGEKDMMVVKLKSAQARIRIQEQLEGLSVDGEVQALDNVREHIKSTVAQASLGKELNESSHDGRLKVLRAQSGEGQAKQQLELLKAAAAAKAAGQKKTI